MFLCAASFRLKTQFLGFSGSCLQLSRRRPAALSGRSCQVSGFKKAMGGGYMQLWIAMMVVMITALLVVMMGLIDF